MSSGTDPASGAGPARPGEVDYRFARAAQLGEFKAGRLKRSDICDAQPELLRNARACSEPTRRPCPICTDSHLVEVTYVFGPRLPKAGRCVTSAAELRAMAGRSGQHAAYVVEVCTDCRWNHLVRSQLLGLA